MNKKTLLSFVLAVLSVNSSISYGMEAGVQIEPPPSRVNRKGMDRITYGKISQYLPMETRAKLAEVCKEADFGIDFTSGYIDKYMDLYRIISKTNRDENLARGRYEINTAEDFLEIYKIITKNKFKIFRVSSEFFSKKSLYRKISTTFYDIYHHYHYVMFPVSYNFNNEDYDLSKEEEKYIKTLKAVENQLKESECVYENFPLERFFKINFNINENMYPKYWNNSVKQEFNNYLSTFLKRQFVFTKDYYSDNYMVCNDTLTLENMKTLSDMLVSVPKYYHITNDIYGPFGTCKNNVAYQVGTSFILEKLWNEGKISQKFNYMMYGSKKSEKDGLKYHPMYRVFNSSLGDCYDRCYCLTGLSHDEFINDFEKILNNLDTDKIFKIKSNLCLSICKYVENLNTYLNCFFSNGSINFDAILNLLYVLKFSDIDSYENPYSKNVLVDISKYFLNRICRNVKSLSENETIEKYGEKYLKTMEILREIVPEEF